MKTTLALLIASLLLPTLGICQDADLESSKAKAAVREYERKLEDVDKDYQKQLKDLEKSYQMKAELVRARLITNLNAALEEEARKINLEEANKIKAVMDEAKKYEAPTLGGLLGQPEKQPTKTAKIKAPKVRIPNTAVKFNGHHYAVVSIPMTPNGARIYAESFGAHLARIESAKENGFARQLIETFTDAFGGSGDHGHVWVDGSDEINEGQWFFSDGKPMTFTNWLGGQPNSDEKGEHHISFDIGSGKWRDSTSVYRMFFLIEWDK